MAQYGVVAQASKNIWGFDPTSIPGCVLWLDGDDPNTMVTTVGGNSPVAVGGSVAQWRDKSILLNHANNGTSGATQPVRGANNDLQFVGASSQFLQLSSAAATVLPTAASDGTYFTVSKQIVTSTTAAGIFSHGTSGDSTSRNIYDRDGGAGAFITQGATDLGPNPSVSIVPRSVHILALTVRNLVASVRATGGQPSVADIQNTRTVVNTGTTLAFVGRGLLGITTSYTGSIYEVLVFNSALSTTDVQTIEGYLAWKWGIQNSLPLSHPFNNSSMTPYFTPNDFGASLWYDAADSGSVFTNAVYQWSDKSGSNNHVTQTNLSLCPLYTASNGITFNGFSNQLLFTTPNFIAGVNFTFFVVERRTISKSSNFFLSGSSTTTNSNLHVGYGGFTGVDVPFVGFYSNDNGGVSIGAYTTPVTRIFKFNLTTTARTIFINGTQSGSTYNTSTKLVSYAGGAVGGGSQGYYQGDILEMICYTNPSANATSFDNDQRIEGYLAQKWGISLPGGHPYVSGPPGDFVSPTASVSGCALWLDSADTATVLQSLYWQNKSFRTVSGRNSSGFPTYETNIVNGRNAVLVSDLTQGIGLNVFNNANFSPSSGQVSFFAVPYSLSTGSNITDINVVSRLAVKWTTTAIEFSLMGTGPVSFNQNSLVGSPFIVELTSAGTNSIGTLYVNGTQIGTLTTGNPSFTSFMPVLSRDGTLGPTYFCEVIGINNLVTTVQRQQIEGYLAWKWGLQASLPASHPYALANYFYSNTRPFLRNFSPVDISDCVMWFDGADLTTMFQNTAGTTPVTGTGNSVRLWRDKSGMGNNITSDAVGSSPTLTTSTNPQKFNVVFDGGDYLSNTAIVNNSNTYTKIIVFNRNSTTAAGYQRLFSYGTTTGDQQTNDPSGFHIQADNSQTRHTLFKSNPSAANFDIVTNTYYVVTIVANPLTISLFLNGSLTAAATFTLPNTNFSGTTFRLGTNFTPLSNQGWPGAINEVLSYNRQLSITEYQEIEGYLAWKWGFNSSLPAAHPFRRFPTPSLTPIQPELQLYKQQFDPGDLSPDIWFDPQDKSTIAVDSNNRVVQWTNKGVSATCSSMLSPLYSSQTLNSSETISNAVGLSGPLITTSTTGAGRGMDYMDFSNGGSFYISSVNISGETAVITLGTPEVGTVTGGSISAFSITSASITNTTTFARLYFSTNNAFRNMTQPFATGSIIRVTGSVNSGGTTLNGDWPVTVCTPFYVQFARNSATDTVGTVTAQGTISSVALPNLATVTYTTSSTKQNFLAGHTLASISGMTPSGLNGTTPTILSAGPKSIQFLTGVATGTINSGGTITGPTIPHNIPQGAQVSVGLVSGYTFSANSTDTLYPLFGIDSISSITTSGRGTPYIVASATTNTITVNIPNTTSYPTGFPGGNMRFSAGRVDYGAIISPASYNQNVANTLISSNNNSTRATIGFTNFSRLRNNTFLAGDTVVISGVTNPTTYNGFWYVTGGTNSGLSGTVTIDTTSVGTLANMVSTAGTINRATYTMPSGCLGIRTITVVGTTATLTYNNSTNQINGTPNGVPFRAGHRIYIARTTATGASPDIFNGMQTVLGQSTDSGRVGTLTFTTTANSGTTAGTGILTRGTGGTGLTGAFATTSGTITDTTATVTFANQPIVPFIPGQQIFITGTTSSSTDINGTWTVLSSTNFSVTFTITGSAGTLTVQGTISAAVLVVTSGTYASPNLSLNFSPTLNVAPFAAGSQVSVFGVTPTANIGNWVVVSSTNSSVVLNVPTGSGPITAPFTGTVALALPLTHGTAAPHGLLAGNNICPPATYAYNTNGENWNGVNSLVYTINAVPSVCTFQTFPLLQYYLTPSASFIQATVGPSMRLDPLNPILYPLSAYCLENTRSQASGGIFNGANASMMIVPHAYSVTTRTSESGFAPAPVLATASTVNAESSAKGNIAFVCFVGAGAPRVNPRRQNQNFGGNEFYQNGVSQPDDNSSFRLFSRSLNLTSSTVNDVDPQTDIVGFVGARYENRLLALGNNAINLVSRVTAVVTNAVWAANSVTLTIVTAGVVPIQPGDTIVVQGIVNVGTTPSGFNGTFVVTGTPTLTSVVYPLATNPGGTYVPGTGTVIPTTSTPLTTGHIRMGAYTNATSTFPVLAREFAGWFEAGISEVIAFNRILTTEERQLLEGYLAQKYVFQNNLGGRSTTTVVTQPNSIRHLFSSGTAPPYTISMSMGLTSSFLFPGTSVVVAGCTESPMVNGTWAVGAQQSIYVSGTNDTALTRFVSQNATPNPVLAGVPNTLASGTGTVTLTGNSTGVAMSAAQNVTSGAAVSGAIYTVTIPPQTVTVVNSTFLRLTTPPVFSAGTSISGVTLPVNSVLVRGCVFTSGSNSVPCNTTTATTGLCPSTSNILVLPTTTTTNSGTAVSSYNIASPPTTISPILPSNTGGVPVLSGVPNPIVGGTGTVILTGNSNSITGITSQSITSGTVVTGSVYTVSLSGLTTNTFTTTSLQLSSPPVFSAGTTLSGVSMFVGSTLLSNCVFTSGSNSVTFPTTTIFRGLADRSLSIANVTYMIVLPTTTTTNSTGTVTSVSIATPTTFLSPIPVTSTNTITGTPITNSFIHPYRTGLPSISSTSNLAQAYTQGLATWFDAANPSTIGFSSGNFVNSWTSAGGSLGMVMTNNLSSSNWSNPTYVTDAASRPYLKFLRLQYACTTVSVNASNGIRITSPNIVPAVGQGIVFNGTIAPLNGFGSYYINSVTPISGNDYTITVSTSVGGATATVTQNANLVINPTINRQSTLKSTLTNFSMTPQFTTQNGNNEYTNILVFSRDGTGSIGADTGYIINYMAGPNTRITVEDGARRCDYNLGGSIITRQFITYGSATLVSNIPYILINYRRGLTSFTRLIGNGTIVNTVVDNSRNLALIVAGGSLRMGAYDQPDATFNNAFSGGIYEHMLFKYALTDQAIFQIEGYLAWKWGLQNSLPTTHPYYKIRP